MRFLPVHFSLRPPPDQALSNYVSGPAQRATAAASVILGGLAADSSRSQLSAFSLSALCRPSLTVRSLRSRCPLPVCAAFPPVQVSNAIKFSPRGRELRVRLELSDGHLEPALLAVGTPPGAGAEAEADGGQADGCDAGSGTDPQSAAALDPVTAAAGALPVGRLIARVTVTDEGAGVPLEHQANLFKVSSPRIHLNQRGAIGPPAVRCPPVSL